MSERNRQVMSLYQEFRFKHQKDFYERNSREFKAAHSQLIVLTGVIMIFTAAVAAITAATDSPDWKPVLAILAVVFPALSTALSAYNELFAFERQSKLYQDAEKALQRASAESPNRKGELSDSDYDIALGVYINIIEGIFRKEQGQWGQLESQAKTVELSAAKTTQMLEEAKEQTAGLPEEKATASPKKETTPAAATQPEDSGSVSSGESGQAAPGKPEEP